MSKTKLTIRGCSLQLAKQYDRAERLQAENEALAETFRSWQDRVHALRMMLGEAWEESGSEVSAAGWGPAAEKLILKEFIASVPANASMTLGMADMLSQAKERLAELLEASTPKTRAVEWHPEWHPVCGPGETK